MKKRLLVSSVIALSLCSGSVFAQQSMGSSLPARQNDLLDKSIVSGHFEIDKPNKARGVIEHINVNYAIAPAPFTNTLQLQLNTPDPMYFAADVIDAKGTKRIHWQPAQKSHSYNESVDISQLEPGAYQINITNGAKSESLYSISFQKVQSGK